jgi:cytochrome c
MKKMLLAAVALGVLATPAFANLQLAQKYACVACHAVDKKIVGPAYKDVAKKYTAKDEAMLVEKVLKGGKGNWGTVPMPPNAAVKPEEATKLVKWILSLK